MSLAGAPEGTKVTYPPQFPVRRGRWRASPALPYAAMQHADERAESPLASEAGMIKMGAFSCGATEFRRQGTQ